ncbi:MAG: hypothetical protein AAFY50_22360 [Cyanobacteria bacterium J06648_1]
MNNMSKRKTWVTPTIEEAPVQMTEGGFFNTNVEFFFLANDSKNDDKPASAS